MTRHLVTWPVLLTWFAAGPLLAPALAQQEVQRGDAIVVAPSPPNTFGTQDEVAYTIQAQEFDTSNSSVTWNESFAIPSPDSGYTRGITDGLFAFWAAGFRLPAGAQITRLELSACDSSATAELRFSILRIKEPPGSGISYVTLPGTTGGAATPGCGLFSIGVDPEVAPVIVDNVHNSYIVFLVNFPGTQFSAARVFYRLTVSAAPGSATFGDVPPTHPFFQFVEALVASGITAGCGGGAYCVDNPITRGEMAVFLAKALGLHFAP